MQIFLCLILGFIVGVIVTHIHKTAGVLLIDQTNPENIRFRFVVNDEVLDGLTTKKKVVLKIDSNAQLSQK